MATPVPVLVANVGEASPGPIAVVGVPVDSVDAVKGPAITAVGAVDWAVAVDDDMPSGLGECATQN
jgi:hypothetical protein